MTVSSGDRRIDVCITVDTEFSLGGLARPGTSGPLTDERVNCRVGTREWGVPHLLAAFARYGIRATFFIETLHVAYFGDAPMGRVVEQLLAAGHDVQLHLHPQWLYVARANGAGWLGPDAPPDNCEGRSLSELVDMIASGIETFRRWGAPVPIALRTGGLRVDRTVYQAMRQTGLFLASNVGWGHWEPDETALRIAAGRWKIEGVTEVPVLTYRQATFGLQQALRLCTITATSSREMRALLRTALTVGASPFVILTHPFEFVRFFAAAAPHSRSRINLGRLDALCRFLQNESDHYPVVTFADSADRWRQLSSLKLPPIRVPPTATVGRLIEQRLNDSRHFP